jgi:hypothetical protein
VLQSLNNNLEGGMPKYYELILHSSDEAASFPSEADEAYASVKVPEVGRHSTMDALILRQVQMFWSREVQQGRLPKLKDHSEALLYLKNVAAAYRAWNQFKAEYAEVIALSESRATGTAELAAENNKIFKQMQKDGIFLEGLNATTEALLIKSLLEQREKLKNERTDNSATTAYSPFLFDAEPNLKKTGDAFAAYFARLGVSSQNNKDVPENYLMKNFNQALDRDSLLYVRACEELGCSLNPQGSDFARGIVENVGNQVTKHLNKHHDKEQPLIYGSFASGLLLRDLVILKQLLESGHKQFELVFVDQAYKKLITQVQNAEPVTMAEQVAIDMQMKAINEFANWMATHVDCGKTNPLKIHFFATVAEAEAFFKTRSQKMDILVAQDYFLKDGTMDAKAATPMAHSNFMQLARTALKGQSCFFELVKDDKKQQIYLNVGIQNTDGSYTPFFTNVHELDKQLTKTYPFTSLGFFTGEHENVDGCAKGALCTTHPYHSNRNGPGSKSS